MKHFLSLLLLGSVAWVEFQNIGINPGSDDTVTLVVNEGACIIEVNAQDALNNYPKIEKEMLKKCFGEGDTVVKTP